MEKFLKREQELKNEVDELAHHYTKDVTLIT